MARARGARRPGRAGARHGVDPARALGRRAWGAALHSTGCGAGGAGRGARSSAVRGASGPITGQTFRRLPPRPPLWPGALWACRSTSPPLARTSTAVRLGAARPALLPRLLRPPHAPGALHGAATPLLPPPLPRRSAPASSPAPPSPALRHEGRQRAERGPRTHSAAGGPQGARHRQGDAWRGLGRQPRHWVFQPHPVRHHPAALRAPARARESAACGAPRRWLDAAR
jgi:hypothetical protein